jgi:ubiquinone/menaquinone biosynthesis C-methylase UbiE
VCPSPRKLNDAEVGAYWEGNAAGWTALVRAGYDVWRDLVNTPAFIAMLPSVDGALGLDLGCGEGANTRSVARLGAKMTGVDIAQTFIERAVEEERREPLGISYLVASAQALPFADEAFDFVTAFMSLMDIPDYEAALREVQRALRPGGFFQFSILHPCFFTAARELIRDERGVVAAVANARYFEGEQVVEAWTFGSAPPAEAAQWPLFAVPYFHRTLSEYLNALLDAGLRIERIGEPHPSDELARQHATLRTMIVVASLLHVRARRP